ncbi:MAG TPA: hypothetical protein VEW28_04610 [Candidatus Kapabacteria bacterium]|nr:hypothetical protein [Candidatus Kapabacteria bacterium]
MENAKALHIFFDDSQPQTDFCLSLIRKVRTSIDLPLGLTIDSVLDSTEVKRIFESGVYRINFRNYDNLGTAKSLIEQFTPQQFAFYISNNNNLLENLSKLKSIKACRVICQTDSLDTVNLKTLQSAVVDFGLRLSLVVRVFSYVDFARLAKEAPNVDSLIFDGVLESDSFPCQQIWRLDEERAFNSFGSEANLWKNPLEGVPHI